MSNQTEFPLTIDASSRDIQACSSGPHHKCYPMCLPRQSVCREIQIMFGFLFDTFSDTFRSSLVLRKKHTLHFHMVLCKHRIMHHNVCHLGIFMSKRRNEIHSYICNSLNLTNIYPNKRFVTQDSQIATASFQYG